MIRLIIKHKIFFHLSLYLGGPACRPSTRRAVFFCWQPRGAMRSFKLSKNYNNN